jgi:hypothetical protein
LFNPTRTPVIEGTSAGDTLFFTPNLEQVTGGLGTDTLVYSSQYAFYRVRRQEGIVLVDDLQDSGGPARLASVERLAFADGTLALDVGAGETAGTLYRLYQAAFDRAPDRSGMNYWIDTVDRGLSAEQAAYYFFTSSEFAALYGRHPSDELLLTRHYHHVLDREPDPEGFGFWLSELERGLQAEQMLIYFAQSPENQQRVAGEISEGIWLG